ncbi:MAG: PstS family phosphate ABC transporter substrate-binding protein [Bdellovibrionales bacterium]|nr:PstS family phosphate ABC transporter substrate-binding protein [Bdellovibrionales bacterium]
MKKITLFFVLLMFSACTQKEQAGSQTSVQENQNQEIQTIKIDGSSTVYPLTEAVVEEYQAEHQNVRITVGVSGTGGGMKKFVAQEIDITGASRTIKDTEKEQALQNNIAYTELKIAFDGISVVVNPKNSFASSLTVEELKNIWKAGSTVKTWKDVRAEWPNETIVLYGPGTDSGTFDYFTEEVLGKVGAIRPDFTASENDDVLVRGVEGDEYAMGFFGFAYYLENKDKLKLIAIDDGKGPVSPSPETIKDGSYHPLARPIFIYVNNQSLQKPQIKDFVKYFIDHSGFLAGEVGYVALDDQSLQTEKQKIQ